MRCFFGFAIADSMFPANCTVKKESLTPEQAMAEAGKAIPCLNPSHVATIQALAVRFGIEVAIPEKPPVVSLKSGDSVIVMGVRGLPRLTDRHEYTEAEIASAAFVFSRYTVI